MCGTSPIGHQKRFLLKFARDRRRYLRWVFEAKKGFGLSVLDYMVTSNWVFRTKPAGHFAANRPIVSLDSGQSFRSIPPSL